MKNGEVVNKSSETSGEKVNNSKYGEISFWIETEINSSKSI